MKRIILFLISFLFVFSLTGCGKKSVELTLDNSAEYLSAVNNSTFKDPTSKSATYYVGYGEATDDDNILCSTGYVYDKLSWVFDNKGKPEYVYEDCEVTVTVSCYVANIYQDIMTQGYYSSKAKQKNVTETITIKLDSNGNGSGTLTVKGFGSPLNAINGICDYSITDMKIDVKGKVTER